ncbi:MAG: tetratricopeptide repeat protein [Promethearchaeota archaeon]
MEQIKVGDLIGLGYQVLKILGGEGKSGMGIVYICHFRMFRDAIVVLKTLQDRFLLSEKMRNSFKREALIWIQLGKHPNIVQASEIIELNYRLFIFLEYIAPDKLGRNTLTHYLHSPISLEKTLEWGIQFCKGMEYVGSRGIATHGDIKPDNIMITNEGTLKITDFGLAKLRVEAKPFRDILDESKNDQSNLSFLHMSKGGIGGTIPWMSPEQFEDISNIKSDIYSFGIVLYQMVNKGKLPFIESTIHDFYLAHKTKEVPNLKSKLFPVIKRCLQKNPQHRYNDFKELRKDLEKLYQKETKEIYTPPKEEEIERDKFGREPRPGSRIVVKYDKANSFFKLGLYDKAIKLYKKILKNDPKDSTAAANLALSLANTGKLKEAIKIFEEVYKRDPNDFMNRDNFGWILMNDGQYKRALKEFRSFLRNVPKHEVLAYMCTDSHYYIGQILRKKGKIDNAIQEFKKSLHCDSRQIEARKSLGEIYFGDGRYNEALNEFKEILKRKPHSAYAHYMIGEIFLKTKNYEKAIQKFTEALLLEFDDYHLKEYIIKSKIKFCHRLLKNTDDELNGDHKKLIASKENIKNFLFQQFTKGSKNGE